MKRLSITLSALVALSCATTLLAGGISPKVPKELENVTLEQALDMAESLQPQIAEAKAVVEAAEGRAKQAGTYPNPEAVVGAQQLGFSGGQSNEEEYVAGVAQVVPLGARLGKARQAELLDREVLARGLDVKRREIRKRVHRAFATALYQEKAYQAQNGFQQSAQRAVDVTRARVELGDALNEELARAEMELALTKVELSRAESLLKQGLVSLVAAIGDSTLTVKSLAGSLDAVLEIPTLEDLMADLGNHPEMALADADIKAREARVDLAKAERVPDVRAEVLYHRLESSRANTVDLGLSIPLPLFNRNQGKLREAQAERVAAGARAELTRTESATRLRGAYLQLTSALTSARTLKTEVLPRAQTVLSVAETRFAAGDLGLAEILPLRRNWAAVELAYLESLRDVMQAWAELKSFTR